MMHMDCKEKRKKELKWCDHLFCVTTAESKAPTAARSANRTIKACRAFQPGYWREGALCGLSTSLRSVLSALAGA